LQNNATLKGCPTSISSPPVGEGWGEGEFKMPVEIK